VCPSEHNLSIEWFCPVYSWLIQARQLPFPEPWTDFDATGDIHSFV